MLMSLVAPRFDFYLLFLACQGGSNQSLVVLRPKVKREENIQTWQASNTHHYKRHVHGMCGCCGHDSEKKNTYHVKKQVYMACTCGVA